MQPQAACWDASAEEFGPDAAVQFILDTTRGDTISPRLAYQETRTESHVFYELVGGKIY